MNNTLVAQDNLGKVKALLSNVNVKRRFEDILGAKANQFMASIINAVNANPELRKCEPTSVISSAIVAATLDLPIDQNLGFSYIIPYQVRGQYKAQFQIGYRGYIQLAIRSGAYKTIHATEVYEGEIKNHNRLTGEIEYNPEGRKSNRVIGYLAYFKLLNGFEKYYYMSVEEVERHAQKYSKAYNARNGTWKNEFHAMAIKTVLKMLLKKYGILSVEMQTALMADQAVVKVKGDDKVEYEYVDNPNFELDAVEVDDESDEEDKIPDETEQISIPFDIEVEKEPANEQEDD
jgi:recombination protein RecT